MKYKQRDVEYCGVNEKKIRNANPEIDWESVHYFKEFVIDRYKIHKRKDIKQLPAPWTKNPILQEFKFTNVRREHDRQTRYLIDNISKNKSLTLEDKIVNTFLFRAWNNWDTLRLFGFPYTAEEIYSPELKRQLWGIYASVNKTEPNRLWYNNAYNQGGTKCAWKFENADIREVPYKFGDEHAMGDDKADDYTEIPLRPFNVGIWLGRGHVVDRLLKAKDQQEAFNIIKSVRGFADFLAYQVFVDLTYIKDFPFSENEFVVAGPGCKRGIDHIFIKKSGMTYEECLFWLRDQIEGLPEGGDTLFNSEDLSYYEEAFGLPSKKYEPYKLFSDLPEWDRRMNVMSIENCMCELSKYMKAVKGTGRPKNKYKPYKEPVDRYPGETQDILKKIKEAGE